MRGRATARAHDGQPIVTAGVPLSEARAAMILMHGRGGTAEDILTLVDHLPVPGFAFLALRAAGNTWYPYPFMTPLAQNEPHLSSALRAIDRAIEQVAAAGVGSDRLILLGFSQGACLVTEFAARRARRYAGIAGLTGGLIGPDDTPRDYAGSLEGTPVFLGSAAPDPHIPRARIEETARVLERLGGQVTLKFYPGAAHSIRQDELDHVRKMMDAVG